VIDETGLPTVSITLAPEITRLVRPSLACFVAHPFGLTLGDVGDEKKHRAVLESVLRAATEPHPGGTIVDLGFRWTKDDLRERQLAKGAD
jgi:hypothetical protein